MFTENFSISTWFVNGFCEELGFNGEQYLDEGKSIK